MHAELGGHPPGSLSVQALHSDHLAGPLVELVEPAQRMSWIALEQKVCHQGPVCEGPREWGPRWL